MSKSVSTLDQIGFENHPHGFIMSLDTLVTTIK
jgi:hypothetical protein